MADLGFLPGGAPAAAGHPAGRPAAAVLGDPGQRDLGAGQGVPVRPGRCTPSTTRRRRSRRWSTTCSPSTPATAPQVIRELAQAAAGGCCSPAPSTAPRSGRPSLTKNGIPAVDLHGNLSQNARERNLAAFSAGSAKVLVATDIAARGIHVDDIELVVHLDPPTEHKAYLHRSGRTARAGAGGTVDHRDAARPARRRPQADEAGRHHRGHRPGRARASGDRPGCRLTRRQPTWTNARLLRRRLTASASHDQTPLRDAAAKKRPHRRR